MRNLDGGTREHRRAYAGQLAGMPGPARARLLLLKTAVAKARTARASEEDTLMAEANALRGGTEEYVPTAAKTAAAKARTARASEEDTPMAEANALRGGTEEHMPTAAETTVSKTRTARA